MNRRGGGISAGTIERLVAAAARRERAGALISSQMRRGAGGSRRVARGSTQTAGALELEIYGVIGADYFGDGDEITVQWIKRQIDAAGPHTSIRLRINSPGGDVFEGVAILNLLRSQGKPVECFVDGLAASAASVVAMAGDTIVMGSGAMMMIHCASGMCIGYADDHRQEADILDAISGGMADLYSQRTGLDLARVHELMIGETWLSAQDCLQLGFATEILTLTPEESARALSMARGFRMLGQYRNAPPILKAGRHGRDSGDECECDCDACVAGRCSDCSNTECEDPNCEDCPMQSSASEPAALARMAAALRSPEIRHRDRAAGAGRLLSMRRSSGTAIYALAGSQVSGLAAPYNSLSCDLGGFKEIYAPGCFAESLAAGDDARVLVNHDVNGLLGRRSAGTARFWEDAVGLHYSASLPDTQPARDLKVLLKRGDVRESSAAFYITQHRWEQRGQDRVRVIEKARLVEVSPHAFAAYDASTAEMSDPDFALKARVAALRADCDRELLACQAAPELVELRARLDRLRAI